MTWAIAALLLSVADAEALSPDAVAVAVALDEAPEVAEAVVARVDFAVADADAVALLEAPVSVAVMVTGR